MLVSEPPLNPKKNREKLVELMMESFDVPKVYIGNQAVMSLFATGKTTGTVLDIGEGISHAVPIYEGYAIPHAIQTIPLCGNDITKYLHEILKQKEPDFFDDSTTSFEQAKIIKEKMCYMAHDYDAECKQAKD